MSLTPDETAHPENLPKAPAPSVPTRKLVHGAEIPMLGLGTSPVLGEEVVRQVANAVAAGYRLIDTAENYRNEEGVGEGIRASGADRSVIFLTSKLNREWHSVDGVRQALEASLERLGTDYLDLFLIHWPNPDQDRYVDAVRGLEALREEGLLKAIGVSNFKPAHLQRVVDETGIIPDVNQVQLSPYATRPEVREIDDTYGIATESWSPLGASSTALREDARLRRHRRAPGRHPDPGHPALARADGPRRDPQVHQPGAPRREHRRLRPRAQRRGHGHHRHPRDPRRRGRRLGHVRPLRAGAHDGGEGVATQSEAGKLSRSRSMTGNSVMLSSS